MNPLLGSLLTAGQRALEAIAVGTCVNDMGAVNDAVQQRFTQARVGKHLGPFGKWQISGNERACKTGGAKQPF